MRILIQDPAGKGYFDGIAWDGDVEQAREFESVAQAETFCQEHELSTALIVVKSKDGCHDISYPVGDHNALLVSKPASTEIKSLY